MDGFEKLHDPSLRLSTTMRGNPQVTLPDKSPVRSVHLPTNLESLSSQPGLIQRPVDFFDDTSSEGDVERDNHVAKEFLNINGTMASAKRVSPGRPRRPDNYLGANADHFRSNCEGKRISSAESRETFMRLHPNATQHYTFFDDGSDHSSFASSIRELSEHHYDSNIPAVDVRRSLSPPHDSVAVHDGNDESPILNRTEADRSAVILDAHHLTLQALMRNGDNLHHSLTPPPLQVARLPKRPMSEGTRYRSTSAPVKKVSMLPPPIDTSSTGRLNPAEIVRTPYPAVPRLPRSHRKDFIPSALAFNGQRTTPLDRVLTLSIRPRNQNGLPRIRTMVLPATSEFSTIKTASVAEKEKHFQALDFDDVAFFTGLRAHYHSLMGPCRFLSARSLSRVTVSGDATRAADAKYGWLHAPRSPRTVAWQGLTDSFSEEKMLRYFRNPKQVGKARYAWVSWAHRLAEAPASTAVTPGLPSALTATSMGLTPSRMSGSPDGLARKAEQHEGLEFVLSWSVKRIVSVLVVVILLSIVAALLWIFLGTMSSAQQIVHSPQSIPSINAGGGFRDAGDRVGTGTLIGICVLLVGLTGMGGWLGVSLLVL